MNLEGSYRTLVDAAIARFGSERQVCIRLGIAHDNLTRRLRKPWRIKEEHVLALENLMLEYKQKYAAAVDYQCSCGGTFRHDHYSHHQKLGLHWDVLLCSGCKKMMTIQVLKSD